MKIVYATRRERFNAAHKLWNPEWDEQKNLDIFGKCSNPNWHGHNYDLYVTVKGTPASDTGYCVDLKDLSDLIKKEVIDVFDHKNINLDVPVMKDVMASTENIVIAIWEILEKPINQMGCTLYKLTLYETENNFVEYFGGQ